MLAKVTPGVVSVFPAVILEDDGSADNPLSRYFGRDRSGPGGSEKKDPEEQDHQRILGVGSGVILTADGWIVTNSHVVHLPNGKLADAISVELSDHRILDAVIAGVDALTDLALLKIDAANLTPLPLADSDTVAVGDPVFAVGNPFKVGMTATRGMVSAVRRTGLGINGESGYESFIQTDASINPGNSGGALVNHHGQLAGINTAIWGTREGNIGIGFAIPSNLVRAVVSQLAETGKVTRGFFGLQTSDAGRKVCAAAGLAATAGVKVDEVMAGGPAEMAGLKSGDIIIEAGGQPVITRGDFRLALSLARPGESVVIAVQRAGQKTQMELKAAAGSGGAADPAAEISIGSLPGVKLRKGMEGLIIVRSGRAAAKAGLGEGCEIIEINGAAITSGEAAETALRTGVNSIKTKRRAHEETLAVRLPLPE